MAKTKTNFSQGQLNRASEILGNLSVAWFTVGVISPLFIRPKEIIDLLTNLVVGLTMAGIFAFWSIYLARKAK